MVSNLPPITSFSLTILQPKNKTEARNDVRNSTPSSEAKLADPRKFLHWVIHGKRTTTPAVWSNVLGPDQPPIPHKRVLQLRKEIW